MEGEYEVVVNIHQGFGTYLQKTKNREKKDNLWNLPFVFPSHRNGLSEADLRLCPDMLIAKQCRRKNRTDSF